MFQLFFLAAIFATAKPQEMCFNDKPFTNFTWEMDAIQGECIYIKAFKVEEDKSKYEGRWYGAFLGMNAEKVNSLNCLVWDTFWDKQGHFHNFAQIEEDNITRNLVVEGRPLDEKNGIYEFDAGHAKPTYRIPCTYFYLDEDFVVFWYVDCKAGKKIRSQEAAIGFRRFADIEKNKDKLDMIYKELEKRGGVTTSHRVRHENCNYPPERENPYIKRKKPKQITNCDKNPH